MKLTNDTQKLGSAFGLWVVTRKLHSQLISVRHILERNAVCLYPSLANERYRNTKAKRLSRNSSATGKQEAPVEREHHHLSSAFRDVSKSMAELIGHLEDFPDFIHIYGRTALVDFSLMTKVT